MNCKSKTNRMMMKKVAMMLVGVKEQGTVTGQIEKNYLKTAKFIDGDDVECSIVGGHHEESRQNFSYYQIFGDEDAEPEEIGGTPSGRKKRLFVLGVIVLGVLVVAFIAVRHHFGSPGFACSSKAVEIPTPRLEDGVSFCQNNWRHQHTDLRMYPKDFVGDSFVEIYECPVSNKRLILSNGIPDHDVQYLDRHSVPCEIPWYFELPLNPNITGEVLEPSPSGLIAVATNGVPIYGPVIHGHQNACHSEFSESCLPTGNVGRDFDWHYRTGFFRKTDPTNTTLIGFALDGFPIYGPLDDPTVLDQCNGITGPDGKYQYHVRTHNQVNLDEPYCSIDGHHPVSNWNFVVGCFKGPMGTIMPSNFMEPSILDDCVRVEL